MKICLVGAELLQVDGQGDMVKLIVPFSILRTCRQKTATGGKSQNTIMLQKRAHSEYPSDNPY